MNPLGHSEEAPVKPAEHANHEENLGDEEECELGPEPVQLDASVFGPLAQERHSSVLVVEVLVEEVLIRHELV